MQNPHDSDHLAAISWPDLSSIFSHLDACNPSTHLLHTAPPPPSLLNLLTNDHNQPLTHPLPDYFALSPPSIFTEPAFPTPPPLNTNSIADAKGAETCNLTQLSHHNPSITAVSDSAPGACCKGDDRQDEVAFAHACALAIKASVDIDHSMSRTGSHADLSDFGLGAASCKGVSFKQSGKKGGAQVQSESARRKQMTRLFHTLRSLLPNIVPQNDRCIVIDKTCEYIKSLERQLRILKRRAQVLASIVDSSGDSNGRIRLVSSPPAPIHNSSCMAADDDKLEAPHVHLSLAGSTFININIGCYEKNGGLFPVFLSMIERRHLEVLSANRSQQAHVVLYVILVKAHHLNCPSKLELEELKVELFVEASKMLP